MSCLAIMRGLGDEINNTPIVNGQFFIETDQLGTQDPSKYNKIHIDSENERIKLGISNWDGIIDKPFESVGDTLSTAEGKLSIHTEWDRIADKPFETLGNGINVNSNKELNTDIWDFEYGQYSWSSTWDYSNYGWEYIKINNNETIINGTKYIELEKVLSIDSNNIFVFKTDYYLESFGGISSNADIKVYSSIWNYYPKKVIVKKNKCKVIFPPYSVPNTTLKCRIYIKEV